MREKKPYTLKELKSVIQDTLVQEGNRPESISRLVDKYNALRRKYPRMPSSPHAYYAKKGWKTYRDLFGLKDINHYSLDELKSVIKQVLKKEGTHPDSIVSLCKKYQDFRKNDVRMPCNPNAYYAEKGWKDYRDLFGLPCIEFYSFEQLKSVIKQTLEQEGIDASSIPRVNKYLALRKKDPRMPSGPSYYYAEKGWKDYRDLFGLPVINYYPLAQLKLAIKQALQKEGSEPKSIINVRDKYLTLRRKDPRMHSSPREYYAKRGWKSYRDLFGLQDYCSLEQLKSLIKQALEQEGIHPDSITSLRNKYKDFRKNNTSMPSQPNTYYAEKGWKNYRDLFGLPDIKYYSLEELKSAIKQSLEQEGIDPSLISRVTKYKALRKKDPRIPSDPYAYYHNQGWKNHRDLFGLPDTNYYSLEQLKSKIKQVLKQEGIEPCSISSLMDKYTTISKKDPRMPANPRSCYGKNGWKGYRNLFGLQNIEHYSLEQLKSKIKQVLKQEGIEPNSIVNIVNKYRTLRIGDIKIPSNPSRFYSKKDWKSYRDVFGLPDIKYYTLRQLKSAIKNALEQEGTDPESITSCKGKYLKLRKKDHRMHSTPNDYYTKRGWISYRNLFGLSDSKWYSYYEAQNAIQLYLEKNGIDLYSCNLSDLFILISRSDPKIPSMPHTTYAEYWLGLEYFFRRKTFYPFEKARQIAKSKGYTEKEITKQSYERLRLEDPMFPPFPEKAYLGHWRTLQYFFSISDGRYKEFIDAQRSAVRIAQILRTKITSRTYPEIAKMDPRLPSSIDRYKPYLQEWRGWKSFSGALKYDVNRAREIALKNEWFSFKEYEKGHNSDMKLPAEPAKYYGLSSYAEFIEFSYWGVIQVKTYCYKNKISSVQKYIQHAQKNVYLKVRYRTIEGVKKASDFLYKPKPFENIEDLGFKQWAELARKFLNGHAKRAFSRKTSQINRFLKYLISKNALPNKPFELFVAGSYIEPLEPLIEKTARGKYLESTIIEFVRFVMNDCCYDRDEDTGQLISITPDTHFRHPYQNSNIEFESTARLIQTIKPPLDFSYIEAAKQYLIPDFVYNDNNGMRRCTTFTDLTNAHLLFAADWFEVDEKTYQLAKRDPNCATKTEIVTKKSKTRDVKQKIYKIWSPARAIAMYVLFSLPLRGLQICYLDSGEADDCKLIEQNDGSLTWVTNDNPLAGLLKNRGFLHHEFGDVIGMNISTNKTSNKEGGYTIPWIPLDVAKWIIRLRDWQSKYNPLSNPTPWSDITTPVEIHQKVLTKRGSQCFLFRDPRDSLKRKTNLPGSQPFLPNTAFSAFEKLLYLIQNDEMPLAKLKDGKSGKAESDFQSIYSPHTLRVSHISALLFEGDGLDPIIVQKLVGHANLVMTIYYGVINDEQMRDKLDEQYKEIAANKQKQYQASLLSRNIEEAKGDLIYLSVGAGEVMWENSAIRFKDSGMCPVANGRCDEGGPPINPNSKTFVYHRAKSCYQCRFFVTGPAFLGGLLAKFNEVNVARKRASNRIECLENKKKITRMKKKQAEDQRQPTDNIKLQLEQINTAIDAEQVNFYNISTDQAAIFGKVLKCISKINEATNDKNDMQGVALILNREYTEVGVSLDESSDFRMLAEICEDAQIYDSIDDSEAVILREKFLDTMLTDNGFDAMFFKLDEKQSRFIGNQMQKLLLTRLKSWKSVEKLIYGDMQLSDLMTDNDGNFQVLREEMSLLINGFKSEASPVNVKK
ncbi:hypothetical protein H4F26_16070 [Vibrio alginolyticus]|uniref:VPA1269 family protein n=1 Tax=Vibrio alginolyticus TaxID=663 RepID=UPI001D5556A4|nr:hypothetical protein [Vibrio alginolyticus]ELB2764883.1 hypothetical protein [Vibrio alginolyticus]